MSARSAVVVTTCMGALSDCSVGCGEVQANVSVRIDSAATRPVGHRIQTTSCGRLMPEQGCQSSLCSLNIILPKESGQAFGVEQHHVDVGRCFAILNVRIYATNLNSRILGGLLQNTSTKLRLDEDCRNASPFHRL